MGNQQATQQSIRQQPIMQQPIRQQVYNYPQQVSENIELPKAPNTLLLMNTNQLSIINKTIKDIEKVKTQIINNMSNWNQHTQFCDKIQNKNVDDNFTNICKKPVNFMTQTIDSMISWLHETYAIKQGEILLTEREYQEYMLRGLTIIYNFIIVLPIIINDAADFVPVASTAKETDQNIQQFMKYLINIISEVVGCNVDSIYSFLDEFSNNPGLKSRITYGSKNYSKIIKDKYDQIYVICNRFKNYQY